MSGGSICNYLSNILLSNSLQDVAACSMGIIDNATDFQIAMGAAHSRREIDALLLKLLTLNFINENRSRIETEINDINLKSNNTNSTTPPNLTPKEKTLSSSIASDQSGSIPNIHGYCHETLKRHLLIIICFLCM